MRDRERYKETAFFISNFTTQFLQEPRSGLAKAGSGAPSRLQRVTKPQTLELIPAVPRMHQHEKGTLAEQMGFENAVLRKRQAFPAMV